MLKTAQTYVLKNCPWNPIDSVVDLDFSRSDNVWGTEDA
jgi:hypothetical protein